MSPGTLTRNSSKFGWLLTCIVVIALVISACASSGTATPTPDNPLSTTESILQTSLPTGQAAPASAEATEAADLRQVSRGEPATPGTPAEATAPGQSEPPPAEVQVIVNTANLRSGPGTHYERVGAASQGQTLEVIAANADHTWFNVRLNSRDTAWIGSTVVEPVNELLLTDVGVAVTIPAPPTPIATGGQAAPAGGGAAAPPPPTSQPAAVCSCTGNVYNCASFGSHAQAQACYNYCLPIAGDIHDLDRDNDGSACESLP